MAEGQCGPAALATGGPRLQGDTRDFQRDGRAPRTSKAGNAGSGKPAFRSDARRALSAICRGGKARCGGMTSDLENLLGSSVSRETGDLLKRYEHLLRLEAERQNL